MCAGAWTRCCSGDAGSTEVVSHASGASFVDARQRSPTLVDASQRRLPTTFPVWDGSRVSRCDSDPLFHPKTAGAE